MNNIDMLRWVLAGIGIFLVVLLYWFGRADKRNYRKREKPSQNSQPTEPYLSAEALSLDLDASQREEISREIQSSPMTEGVFDKVDEFYAEVADNPARHDEVAVMQETYAESNTFEDSEIPSFSATSESTVTPAQASKATKIAEKTNKQEAKPEVDSFTNVPAWLQSSNKEETSKSTQTKKQTSTRHTDTIGLFQNDARNPSIVPSLPQDNLDSVTIDSEQPSGTHNRQNELEQGKGQEQSHTQEESADRNQKELKARMPTGMPENYSEKIRQAVAAVTNIERSDEESVPENRNVFDKLPRTTKRDLGLQEDNVFSNERQVEAAKETILETEKIIGNELQHSDESELTNDLMVDKDLMVDENSLSSKALSSESEETSEAVPQQNKTQPEKEVENEPESSVTDSSVQRSHQQTIQAQEASKQQVKDVQKEKETEYEPHSTVPDSSIQKKHEQVSVSSAEEEQQQKNEQASVSSAEEEQQQASALLHGDIAKGKSTAVGGQSVFYASSDNDSESVASSSSQEMQTTTNKSDSKDAETEQKNEKGFSSNDLESDEKPAPTIKDNTVVRIDPSRFRKSNSTQQSHVKKPTMDSVSTSSFSEDQQPSVPTTSVEASQEKDPQTLASTTKSENVSESEEAGSIQLGEEKESENSSNTLPELSSQNDADAVHDTQESINSNSSPSADEAKVSPKPLNKISKESGPSTRKRVSGFDRDNPEAELVSFYLINNDQPYQSKELISLAIEHGLEFDDGGILSMAQDTGFAKDYVFRLSSIDINYPISQSDDSSEGIHTLCFKLLQGKKIVGRLNTLDSMLRLAKRIESELGGALYDVGYCPITDLMISHLRRQVQENDVKNCQ
ncbi:hypothetical protein MNBD_GAMMA12-2369 [hydrothermal vent metagenome]|uniref:ZipA C-terminal FtsZ-binding domain-containing protein n=1 Tax=hydrothermal vent metagenome TaxID=652676 RepID=A0A3B0Y333_9ZZZZ